MIGTFEIDCQTREDGSTHIARQQISAPWHLGKPYWNGSTLLVQAVNATAGIFAGDQLHLHASIGAGASVLLTSPSASRIHTMNGGQATLDQQINIDSSGWLEWMPELFIPQRKAKYDQSTTIDVAGGGGLYFVETIAPGRVAHGEAFEFSRINWCTRIRHAGKLILAENYHLDPEDSSLCDLKRGTEAGYFASAILITPRDINWRDKQKSIHELCSPEIRIGATRIDERAYLFRLIATGSIAMKDALHELRCCIASDLRVLRETARKL